MFRKAYYLTIPGYIVSVLCTLLFYEGGGGGHPGTTAYKGSPLAPLPCKLHLLHACHPHSLELAPTRDPGDLKNAIFEMRIVCTKRYMVLCGTVRYGRYARYFSEQLLTPGYPAWQPVSVRAHIDDAVRALTFS